MRSLLVLAAVLAAGAAWWLLGGGPRHDDAGAAAQRLPSDREAAELRAAAGVGEDDGPTLAGVQGRTRRPTLTPAGDAASATASAASPAPEASRVRLEGIVRDEHGQPVAGAEVLAPLGVGRDLTALTDAQGRFTLDVPPPGAFALIVTKPGHNREWVGPLGTPAGVLAVELTRAATIRGRVIDATSGTPLDRVLVTASHSVASDRRTPSASDSTATDGTFELTLTREGDYDLRAQPDGGPESEESPDGYVSKMLARVRSGGEPLTLALERALSIRGRLIDEAGQPVRVRVSVDAVGLTEGGEADYTRRQLGEAASGEFAVRALAPGRYRILFQPTAWPFSEGPASVVLAAVEAGTHDLVVRLPIGLTLTGQVVHPTGPFIHGALGRVLAVPEGTPLDNQAIRGAMRNDGSFSIGPLVTSRRWDLHFTGFAGFRPHVERGVDPRSEGITIRLTPGGRIQGRVVLARGQPVPARVPVGLQARTLDPATPGARTFTYTEDDGTFTADGLLDDGYEVEAGGGTSGYLGTTAHDVRPGATDVVLRVVEGVDLVGILVDDRGQPVAATSLQADDGRHVIAMRPYAQVGRDGHFRLRGLAPGQVRLSIRRGEGWVALGELTAPATDVRVLVPPP